jgi:hypothetical protein
LIGIGADVTSLAGAIKQRLQTVRGHIDALPSGLKPPAPSPYV